MSEDRELAKDVKTLLGYVAEIRTEIKGINTRLTRLEGNTVTRELCDAYRKDDLSPKLKNTTSVIAVVISGISLLLVAVRLFLIRGF